MATPKFTLTGLDGDKASKVIDIVDMRMCGLLDLAMTLKHIHWNVVGPTFIGVHEMLDPQEASTREMIDVLAERIATLGGVPMGTPGSLVERRDWDDYDLGKAMAIEHLAALDIVYNGVNGDHRAAIEKLADLDPVSEDILTGQLGQLELFQWFVRAHLESGDGTLATEGITSEQEAADAVG